MQATPEEKFIEVKQKYSVEQLAELAEQMVEDTIAAADLEREKKEYDKEQGELIKDRHNSVAHRAKLYKEGFVFADVMCRLTLNKDTNTRRWIDVSTGEIVLEEPFQPADYQADMFGVEDPDPSLPSPSETNAGFAATEDNVVDLMADDEEKLADEAADTSGEDDESGQPKAVDDFAIEEPAPSDDVFGFEENGTGSDVDVTMGKPEEKPKAKRAKRTKKAKETKETSATKPEFDITDAHERVLNMARTHTGTDPLSFKDNTKSIKVAADVLIVYGYLMGDDHSSVTGLSPSGEKLFEDGYVAEPVS